MLVLATIITVFLKCFAYSAPSNNFEVTRGCLQYNTDHGYKHAHPYYPISRFQHLNVTNDDVKIFRMGVLGPNDGHLRLAPTMYPYDKTEMNEIVLSGWANTKTVVRHYTRNSPQEQVSEIVLREQSSIGMLSYFKPFMFTVAIHPDGQVELTRDEDSKPFLQYRDPKVSADYLGFCNWDRPLVFFYDCPLEVDQRACDGIVFSK
ncbi:AAEL004667-PA [Aedes aegypti]|uniref:AAEL004667-PA n=1 Tax=Aedes aegypti TaxID=7159 RepID=Q17C68_AEDAE|nr:AAEL004667-PA [Aedes aegypti]